MTKFTSNTLTKLNNFSNAIANELKRGLANGDICKHGFEDKHAEVKKFLSMYQQQLTERFGVKVSNILKTSKQLKFVVGSILYKLGDAA